MQEKVHQIKIDFNVTPEIRRYVYVYVIVGKAGCYLIDSGVDGSEVVINMYLESIGKSLYDIKAIFLTHAHPDHIGGASKIKEISNCRIYASSKEKRWIENIDLQFEKRPIPGFYTLVKRLIQVDDILKDRDIVELEFGIKLQVIETPGHSIDELSYLYMQENVVFSGDSIPVDGDIPIWIDTKKSIESLYKISELNARMIYPAWDYAYEREMISEKVSSAFRMIERIKEEIMLLNSQIEDVDEMLPVLCERMNTPLFIKNPLFKTTVKSIISIL